MHPERRRRKKNTKATPRGPDDRERFVDKWARRYRQGGFDAITGKAKGKPLKLAPQ